MYDEFDITSSIKDQFLRDESYGIGIFSYIYDTDGMIIDSLKTILSSFTTAVQTLPKLVEGNYTVITIETLVNKDEGNIAESWYVDDVESISTVKLRQKGNTYWPEAIGVETTNINLDSNKEINIKPKAVGSIINHYSFDFDESDFVKVGFASDGSIDYYSLNPQLDRKDRVKTDLTKSGYINVRLTDDVDDNSYRGSIYVLESELTWMNVAQDEQRVGTGKYITWAENEAKLEDGKVYYAGFYYLYTEGDNVAAASSLGDYDGLLEFMDKWEEWKKDNLSKNAFTPPYTYWSEGTVAAVKSYMADFMLTQDIQYDEVNEKYNLVYFDLSNSAMYSYDFTSATSGLTDAWIYLDGESFTIEQVRAEMERQGYTYNSQNNNNYYYTNSTTHVTVYQSSSGVILVNYYDPKAYGMAPKRDISMDAINFNARNLNGARLGRFTHYAQKQEYVSSFKNKTATNKKLKKTLLK